MDSHARRVKLEQQTMYIIRVLRIPDRAAARERSGSISWWLVAQNPVEPLKLLLSCYVGDCSPGTRAVPCMEYCRPPGYADSALPSMPE